MTDPFSSGEEHNFRSAFEWSAIGMAMVSPDGQFLHVNRALAEMVGYSVEDLQRLDFQTLTHPDDLDADLSYVEQMLTGAIRTFQMEKRYFHRDGRTVWVHLAVSLVWDPDGIPLHFISQIQDITEQKLAARALAQSEARLRVVWESSLDGMRITNGEGTVLQVNDAYCRLVRRPREELEGRSFVEAYQASGHAEMLENYRARFSSHSVVPRFETEVTFWDGRSACLELSNVFLQQEGQDPLLLSVFRDHDQRQRADAALAQLAAIVESSEDAIVGKSLDGRILSWNGGAERMYGYTAAEVLGRSDVFLTPPEQADQMPALMERIAAGTRVANFETVHLTRDGRRLDVSLTLSPIKNNTGRTVGVSAIARDVTAYKRRARELEEAKEVAEHASRVKSEFLANVSHEIRTPMNGILGMTQLALDTQLDAEQRDYLETVWNCSETLLSVINDILDVSRTETGTLKVCYAPFDVRECVSRVLAPFAQAAAAKELCFTTFIAPDVPLQIVGDAGRLGQVLGNLVANAIKFTDSGEVECCLCMREAPGAATGLLEFRVRDTGIGIAPEKHAVIFDAFAQVDGSATRRYGGAGLGLAISRRLIEIMGGRLWVESEPGRGSTFYFTLQSLPTDLEMVESPFSAGIVAREQADRSSNMSFLKKFVRNRSADNSVSQPSAPAPVVEPALPTLDRKLLLEFIDGDGELLTELTGLFNRDAPQMLEEISAGIASQNAEAVTRAAHTLKGSLLNLAAPAATEAALRLERLGRLGDLSGAEQELVSLEVEVRKVVAELASLSGGGIS